MLRTLAPALAIAIASSAFDPGPAEAQEVATPAPVTVAFEQTPVQDVIAFFADYAGRSIVVGAGVSGTVTAQIEGQPWDVALQAVLAAQGLHRVEMESGIILVRSPEVIVDAPGAVATRVFRLSFVTAAEMQPVVASVLSETGTVSVVPSINALVVTDATDVLARVAVLLR